MFLLLDQTVSVSLLITVSKNSLKFKQFSVRSVTEVYIKSICEGITDNLDSALAFRPSHVSLSLMIFLKTLNKICKKIQTSFYRNLS